jgi:hypothetical protein
MRHQILAAILLAAGAARASGPSGFGLEVLVDGVPRPELSGRGALYVEALRGHSYSLRLSNPTGSRVAVALSVDGLNTLDASRTTASAARKWVLAPYETVVIPGWQVSSAASRAFVFTGERGSYGAKLGKTDDLGVIEAIFYRERLPWRVEKPRFSEEERSSMNEKDDGMVAAPASPDRSAARDHSKPSSSSSSQPLDSSSGAKLSDEYAATGMGSRTRFGVTQVDLDLESAPSSVVRLRYEFRPQLVALGVLPREDDPSRIARRERARGFDDFCPEVR